MSGITGQSKDSHLLQLLTRPRATTNAHQPNEFIMVYSHPQRSLTLAHDFPLSTSSAVSPSHQIRSTRNVSEIIPRLFISDLSFAEDPSLLSSYRITHILSTLSDAIFRPPASLLPNQPVRMHVKLEDLPFAELAAHLPSTTAFIRDALRSSPEARVLVHCAEGISRSVSVVAAFLMAQYGWSPDDAVEYVKSKRIVANPNVGFVQQLHEYARESLAGSLSHPVPPLSAPL